MLYSNTVYRGNHSQTVRCHSKHGFTGSTSSGANQNIGQRQENNNHYFSQIDIQFRNYCIIRLNFGKGNFK